MWSSTTRRLPCCIGICVNRPPRRKVRSTAAVCASTSPTSSGCSRGRASRAISLSRATSNTQVLSSWRTSPPASSRDSASSALRWATPARSATSSVVPPPSRTAAATLSRSSSASSAKAARASSTPPVSRLGERDRLVDLGGALRQLGLLAVDLVGVVLVGLHQVLEVDAGHVEHAHLGVALLHFLAPQT